MIPPSRCPLPPDYKFQGKILKFNPKGEEEWKLFHSSSVSWRGGGPARPLTAPPIIAHNMRKPSITHCFVSISCIFKMSAMFTLG